MEDHPDPDHVQASCLRKNLPWREAKGVAGTIPLLERDDLPK